MLAVVYIHLLIHLFIKSSRCVASKRTWGDLYSLGGLLEVMSTLNPELDGRIIPCLCPKDPSTFSGGTWTLKTHIRVSNTSPYLRRYDWTPRDDGHGHTHLNVFNHNDQESQFPGCRRNGGRRCPVPRRHIHSWYTNFNLSLWIHIPSEVR